MTSPWNQIAKVEPVDLNDIMSEQYARNLQTVEETKLGQHLAQPQCLTQQSSTLSELEKLTLLEEQQLQSALIASALEAQESEAGASGSTGEALSPDIVLAAAVAELQDGGDSDRLIAEMMQAEFDRDHDMELKLYEKQHNKNSKVSVSFSQYRTVPDELLYDSDDDEDEPDEKKHWDRFETNEKIMGTMSKKGFTYDKDGIKITKHDAQLNGVRNACRVMSFPPEFQTGDAAQFDMQLPNYVFNRLKTYSLKSKRANKASDRRENVATTDMGLDSQTCMILYKLVNNQLLEQVNGIISTGKEAIILHADCDTAYEGELILPKEVAIKIFKTTLNEFKQRDRYIKDDYRFKGRFSKQNNRTVINMWAEKEMHNLLRMKSAGIRVPEVIALKKHVLIMSFLGENMIASPKLKDVRLSDANCIVAYEQTVEMMHVLYQKAGLVHADLSEYNILWHEGECWFIDVAQSVEPGHPSALEFMMRDCGNISTFFTKRGVPRVQSKEDLFRSITGLDPTEHTATMLERIHEKGANITQATTNDLDELPDHLKPRSYPFDYAWDKVAQGKQLALDEVLPAIGGQ